MFTATTSHHFDSVFGKVSVENRSKGGLKLTVIPGMVCLFRYKRIGPEVDDGDDLLKSIVFLSIYLLSITNICYVIEIDIF